MDSTFPGPDEPEKTSRQGLTARPKRRSWPPSPACPDCLPAPPAARPWKTPGRRAWAQTLERRPLDDRAQRPRHLGEYGRSAACWGCRSSPRRRRGTRGYWAGCRASARCAWSGSRAPAATVPGWPAIWPRAGRPERGGGRQHRGEQPGQVDAPLRGRRASLSRGVQPGAQARQPVRDSPRPFLSAAVGPRRPVSAGPRSRRFRHHG
jgi:hypothetical protein